MSNRQREAGGVAMDFSKSSEAQLKKVATMLGKSQSSFLLKQALLSIAKTLLGRTTWTMPNADKPKRKSSSKLMNNVILRTLSRETVSSLCSSMMPSTPKDPSSQKQLPSCKVCLMAPWSRRFSKASLLVAKNDGSSTFDLSLPSLS